jgi:hypothetical protein
MIRARFELEGVHPPLQFSMHSLVAGLSDGPPRRAREELQQLVGVGPRQGYGNRHLEPARVTEASYWLAAIH